MSQPRVSSRPAQLFAGLMAAILVSGCASVTPVLDARFGDAVRQARVSQTLNPAASANRDPVLGLDGASGAAAQERYRESFRTPPRAFEILNIGGTISGQ